MLKRKIEKKLENWYALQKRTALLIDGARQVGKTSSIREFASKHYENFIEINLINDFNKNKVFENVKSVNDLLLKISIVDGNKLVEHKTLIFFDEIQTYDNLDIITMSKFLIEQKKYDFAFSGSLLGVTLKNIKSWPVGFMTPFRMYPLDFEEFLWANGYDDLMSTAIKKSFDALQPLPEKVHLSILEHFKRYLITGGFPDAVTTLINTQNISRVHEIIQSIYLMYIKDATQYAKNRTIYIADIYNYMSSTLGTLKKRVVYKDFKESIRGFQLIEDFLWLENSGIAIPVYKITNPKFPLKASKLNTFVKLYYNDVGIFSNVLFENKQYEILDDILSINLGSLYENYVAMELKTKTNDLFYYDSKKNGEIDFILDNKGDILLIEVKSGKSVYIHSALNNLLNDKEYEIKKGYVLSNQNLEVKDKVIYLPIYMTSCILDTSPKKDIILSALDKIPSL